MTRLVLVDTSALYAVLDSDDQNHTAAAGIWTVFLDRLSRDEIGGVTHSGIVVETSALVQRRLGMDAVRVLHDRVLTVLDTTWVDAELHARAVTGLLAAGRRQLSLVDWMSFELMRSIGIESAFAFDNDFEQQGFALLT